MVTRLRDPRDHATRDVMHDAVALVQRLPPALSKSIAVVRDGDRAIVCLDPVETVTGDGHDALQALDELWRGGGFWVGALAYDLGRVIEPIPDGDAGGDAGAARDRHYPDMAFTRFATRVVFEPGRPPQVHGAPYASS